MSYHKENPAQASLSDGSDPQIRALQKEYGGALKNYFRKRGAQPATCEDLEQEVYVRLLKRKHRNRLENPRGYVMQTAWSVWSDHWRRRKTRPDYSSSSYDDVLHSPEGFSPERVLEGKQTVAKAIDVINNMPTRTRQVYLLCHVDGMKRKELAVRLGISVSAIDKHLAAAKKTLGQAFGTPQ